LASTAKHQFLGKFSASWGILALLVRNLTVIIFKAMKDIAIAKGMNRVPLLLDECATNTFENARNTRAILQQYQKKEFNLVLITSDWHINRAHKIFTSFFAGQNVHISWITTNSTKQILQDRMQVEMWLLGQVQDKLNMYLK